MSKGSTLMVVGVLTILTPFIGLPNAWYPVLLPALGAITLVIAHLMRRERNRATSLPAESPIANEAEEGPVSPHPVNDALYMG